MIIINGEKHVIRAGETLLELLEEQRYRLDVSAVEYNGGILSKAAYATTTLHDGDRIEMVSFVGGG